MTEDRGSSPSVVAHESGPRREWSVFSNHGHVLICISREPQVRLREIAARVGITERRVVAILSNLERDGIVRRGKTGRRNTYVIDGDAPMPDPGHTRLPVGAVLELFRP